MTTEPTITGEHFDDRTGVVYFAGDLHAGCEEQLMRAYGEACGAGTRGIVLDFSDLDFLNSGGIGLLVTLLVRSSRQGQRLAASGLSDHYQEVFQLTRLDEAISLRPTLDEARAAVAV
jgi:anti-anti-sigma factor